MTRWQPGQQLDNGKDIIKDVLGGGGFGETYRAQNLKEGKSVAIKVLNTDVQSKPNFQELQTKFVNEALSLARCTHPHVVQVYRIFPEWAGNIKLWCMEMEFIDGTNLGEHLRDKGIFSEAKALSIIQQVGSALSFVHQQGLTHLDVKPENIMLRKQDSEAVLIDFGLARQATAPGKLRTNSNCGTECYAPIELLAQRAERGAYTDVYSLAATLYVMLTGELPCPSQFRQQNIPLIPPKQHNPNISNRVNAAIMKGMELEPQSRPQSVQEWFDLLTPRWVQVGVQWLDLLLPKVASPETTRVVSAVGQKESMKEEIKEEIETREAQPINVSRPGIPRGTEEEIMDILKPVGPTPIYSKDKVYKSRWAEEAARQIETREAQPIDVSRPGTPRGTEEEIMDILKPSKEPLSLTSNNKDKVYKSRWEEEEAAIQIDYVNYQSYQSVSVQQTQTQGA
ncbi:MAG: serine/threonine protein kinase [Microcoleus sp. SU_5_6]|nr:serine/threonine protein kinase [Microcoleus sp. SU_5_6]